MTVVVHQPESIDSAIRFTPAAQKHILNYLSKNAQSQGIRFSVKKTGCSGLSYVVDYVQSASEDDMVLPFEQGYLLCIDKKSFPFLKGMEIDYVKQGLNYKFLFKNPNQTGQCGCGESFTVV